MSCIHHWYTGHLVLELDPDFYLKYPPAGTGHEYLLCKNCGEVRLSPLYVAPNYAGVITIDSPSLAVKPLKEWSGKPLPPPEHITVTEVAQRLHIKENTVRIYLRSGILVGHMVTGGQKEYWMVEMVSVIKYEVKQKEAAKINKNRKYTDAYGNTLR